MTCPKRSVRSCNNCTIVEVWVQIIGAPEKNETDPVNPYPLFKNLKDALVKDGYQLEVETLIQNNSVFPKSQISPPSLKGEITWREDNQKKVLRMGHQFFALHSFFEKSSPYENYENSFKKTLQRVISYIEERNIFEAIQITVRYINMIELNTEQDGSFNIRKHFNTGFFYALDNILVKTSSSFQVLSTKKNRTIEMNTDIKGNPKNNSLISIIQTTGANSLEKKIKLNDESIFKVIESTKEELKELFFDAMTDETKTKIIGAKYE